MKAKEVEVFRALAEMPDMTGTSFQIAEKTKLDPRVVARVLYLWQPSVVVLIRKSDKTHAKVYKLRSWARTLKDMPLKEAIRISYPRG